MRLLELAILRLIAGAILAYGDPIRDYIGNVTAMIYYLKVRDRKNWGENQPEPLREIPPMQIIVDSGIK